MANTRENPYVGPRAFALSDKEKLAGRDRDIMAVYRLLIAERIVLLFSPSGAGKTSLVQAGLIPKMKEKGFAVMPVVRVSREVPPILPPSRAINRYAFSVLESLEGDENLSEEQRIPPEKLAGMRIREYFDQRLKTTTPSDDDFDDYQGSGSKTFLIFDQFEEILTIEPNDRDGKWEFFSQLGEALERRDCWALFAVREDFVAALDPYLRLIPTRLASTFRLDLLDNEAATQAIRRPASLGGVEYENEAVEKLVNDLRSVRVQKPDGSWEPEPQLGRYVEPVQLQVVCFRLWDKIGASSQITKAQVELLGDVNQALAGFYADQMEDAARNTNLSEKEIRAWFENELITHSGIRSQVMWEEGKSGGLSNAVILYLEKTHLIRGETRRGVKWYELAHDRLIEPVRKNNKEWFANNLSVLQRQAMLWETQGRSDNLLLRDQALGEAEEWAKGQLLTPIETEFLETCQDLRNSLQAQIAQKEAEAQRQKAEELGKLNHRLEKSNRDLRVRNFVALAFLVIAAIAVVVALYQFSVATRNAQMATDNQLIAESAASTAVAASNKAQAAFKEALAQKKIADMRAKDALEERAAARAAEADAKLQSQISLAASLGARAATLMEKNPPLAALLSIESLDLAGQTDSYQPVAEQNLRDLLNENPGYTLNGHAEAISHVLFTPDEGLLITTDANIDSLRLWDLTTTDPSSANARLPLNQLRSKLTAIAISPDNRLLAVGSQKGVLSGLAGVVYLWKIENNAISQVAPVEILVDLTGGEVTALAFGTRNGVPWLAAGMSNGQVALVDVSPTATSFNPLALMHGITPINALAFSPDGHWLAGGSDDSQVRVWNVDTPNKGPAAHSQAAPVQMLAYNSNGTYLVGAGSAKELYTYNPKVRENAPFTLAKDLSNVTALVFDPLNPRLVTVGYANGSIKIWDLGANSNRPVAEFKAGDEIAQLAYSADGHWLASSSMDMAVRLWDMNALKSNSDAHPKLLKIFESDITALAFSPGSRWLAVGTSDHEVHLWDFRLGFRALDPLSFGPAYENHASALFSPDGQWLVGRQPESDDTETLRLWRTEDFANGERTPALEIKNLPQAKGSTAAFSPDSKTLAVGSASVLNLYTLADLQAKPRALADDSSGFIFIGFSPDGRWLASCDRQGNLRLRDVANWEAAPYKHKLDFSGLSPDYTSFAFFFSPRGRWLAAIAEYGTTAAAINLVDLSQPEAAPLAYHGPDGGVSTRAYAISQDERWFAVGAYRAFDQSTNATLNGQAYLWDLSAPQPTPLRLTGHNGYVNTLAFNPDSNLLATGDDAGHLRIWDVLEPASALADIHYTNDSVTAVAFSHDGEWLASSSAEGAAGLWVVKALITNPHADYYPLSGHEGPIINLTFSPNDKWLATGSADHTIRLWNLKYPRSQPIVLQGFLGENTALNFEAQMRFLVSNTDQAEAQLWHLSPADLRALACQFANRNLTEGEWQQYMSGDRLRAATCPEFALP